MRQDLEPGDVFPDFELPDHTGTCIASRSCRATTAWCSCSVAVSTARASASTSGR